MHNMKKKVQAQRKFAQGTVVNQAVPTTTATASTSNERRAVESNDRSVNIYNINVSASRLLDEVAFRYPGMYGDNLTINLTRLPESVFNTGSLIVTSTSNNTVQENPSDHYRDESQCAQHTYFLRSCSKFSNVTKEVEPSTHSNTPKKRGRPRKSLRRVKPKRLLSPVFASCSEDEQPLSTYSSSKQNTTKPYIPRPKGPETQNMGTITNFRGCQRLHFVTDEIEPITDNAGNNHDDGAMINDTSARKLVTENNDGEPVNANVIPLRIAENNDGEHVNANVIPLRIVENHEMENGLETYAVVLLNADECDDTKDSIKLLSEGSEDYEDDLFIPESTDQPMDTSDYPNLGTEELWSHDPDVDVVKEEDMPSTSRESRESSHQATAGHSRPVGVIEEAPVFHPTEEEFNDPLVFYNQIKAATMKYGICKVVPPESFEPKCIMANLSRVTATHQYIGRLFKRWGQGTREMCAIRAQLASHNVEFTRPPLIDGLEVDLPKMFQTVQKYGGFLEVTQKQLWTRVAEDMNFFKILNPGKRLDQLYVKYLLPYDIMKAEDREVLHSKIENVWLKKYDKLLKLAKSPVPLENSSFSDSESSSDEDYTTEEENMDKAMYEIPNNDKSTRPILLMNFHKINDNACRILFPQNPHGPAIEDVEALYWSKVSQATDHICVYTASVDTSNGSHGFSTDNDDDISNHKWNLKNFQHNEANIFKVLGPIVSVTSPVLTMGMIFSTHCWHKDPHGLPWVEYHHEGKPKIWYAIPDMRSHKFRKTVEKLCPTVVQNKAIWLPSDLLMIPPDLLLQEGISLTKTIQHPREYIFVLPNAYTSTICTGLTISETVYFAQEPWLHDMNEIYMKLHRSREPMILPPEQLLIALGTDPKTPPNILQTIYSNLLRALEDEIKDRLLLDSHGLVQEIVDPSDDYKRNWNCKEKECDICRSPLFFSKIVGRFKNQVVSKICIKHSQKILQRYRSKDWNLTLVIYVSDEFLKSLLDDFSKKLQM